METKICPNCNKNRSSKAFRRNFCRSCYDGLLETGKLQKLYKPISQEILTKEQEEVLTGLMLGDGCLYQQNKTPNLIVHRCVQDEPYLQWQYSFFKNFCLRPVHKIFIKNCILNGNVNAFAKVPYWQVRFVTRNTNIFSLYREKWYPKGKKIIPRDIVFTPLVLVNWFCDDGCITHNSKNSLSLKLSTNGFIKEDVEFLAMKLSDRYKEHFYVASHGPNKLPILLGSDGAARAFLKEIDNLIPPGMERKALYWRDPKKRFYDENYKSKLAHAFKDKQIFEIINTINDFGPGTSKKLLEPINIKLQQTNLRQMNYKILIKKLSELYYNGYLSRFGKVIINKWGSYIYDLSDKSKKLILESKNQNIKRGS